MSSITHPRPRSSPAPRACIAGTTRQIELRRASRPRMKRKRIEVNPEQPGLNSAFAQISIPDPPPGPEAPLTAPPEPAPVAKASPKGRVVLRRETAHRGGKAVVIVHDFDSRI